MTLDSPKRSAAKASWPERLAPLFRQAAAFGVLVLCLRSSYAIGASAFEHFDEAPGRRGGSERGAGKGEDPGGAAPQASAEGVSDERQGVLPVPGGEHKKAGAVRARRLIVDVGEDRSDVFVDGQRLGQVPYVGQWACATGDTLALTLMPPAGVPTDYRVPCRGEDITVRSEQRVLTTER